MIEHTFTEFSGIGRDGYQHFMPQGTYQLALKLRKFYRNNDIDPNDASRAELMLRGILDREKEEFYPLGCFDFEMLMPRGWLYPESIIVDMEE